MSPRVFVAVGTDHHQFDRLMGWVEDWPAGEIEWFVQHGSSPCPPDAQGAPVLPADRLTAELRAARAVVCHGGPGLIMEVRTAGHRPVVVPRDPALGEHVDGHQLEFVRWLADRTDIRLAGDQEAFVRELRAALTEGPSGLEGPLRPDAVRRFGALVDRLVSGGRSRRGRALRDAQP